LRGVELARGCSGTGTTKSESKMARQGESEITGVGSCARILKTALIRLRPFCCDVTGPGKWLTHTRSHTRTHRHTQGNTVQYSTKCDIVLLQCQQSRDPKYCAVEQPWRLESCAAACDSFSPSWRNSFNSRTATKHFNDDRNSISTVDIRLRMRISIEHIGHVMRRQRCCNNHVDRSTERPRLDSLQSYRPARTTSVC